MPQQAINTLPDPGSPRMVVIRGFGDAKAVTAMLQAGRPVFVVLRAATDDRRRVLDLLAGWALGSGGDLDRIGPNTVLARPAHSGPVRLGRAGMVSAVDEVFMTEGPHALGRDEEERLLPLAATGSVSAQRRIVDSYAELATLFALRVRPRWTSEARAVQVAQEELDRLCDALQMGRCWRRLSRGSPRGLVPDRSHR